MSDPWGPTEPQGDSASLYDLHLRTLGACLWGLVFVMCGCFVFLWTRGLLTLPDAAMTSTLITYAVVMTAIAVSFPVFFRVMRRSRLAAGAVWVVGGFVLFQFVLWREGDGGVGAFDIGALGTDELVQLIGAVVGVADIGSVCAVFVL